jgi:hypothetical protein
VADNVAITAGSGTSVATSERSIGGNTVHVQRVMSMAGEAGSNGQVVPTTTAATLLAARETRIAALIINHSSHDIYVGASTVTTANGVKIPVGASYVDYSDDLIQVIIASGTATGFVNYREYHD